MKIVIKNGIFVNSDGRKEIKDILIEDGIIKSIQKNISTGEDTHSIDASGKYVLPGFVDIHTHLRDFNEKEKETILTGTQAAVKGGFTTIACMPNTKPPIDNTEILTQLKEKIKLYALCHVLPIAALTKDMKDEDITDIAKLKTCGVIAFSDDGFPIMRADTMKNALSTARQSNALVITHCEDKSLTSGGAINEGKISKRLKIKGMPREAEEVMMARNIILAKATGAKLHIAHVSTKGGTKLLEIAKNEGVDVSAEVTPHHLTLTEDIVEGAGTDAKVNPPLRTEKDIEALIRALKNGVIDIIATDHAPHTLKDKLLSMENAAFGISGLETAYPVINTFLIKNKILTMAELINLMCVNPAKLLGIKHGLLEGYPADITIVNPNKEFVVDPEEFFSKGKNTPYKGMKLIGRIEYTIVSGEIVYGGR